MAWHLNQLLCSIAVWAGVALLLGIAIRFARPGSLFACRRRSHHFKNFSRTLRWQRQLYLVSFPAMGLLSVYVLPFVLVAIQQLLYRHSDGMLFYNYQWYPNAVPCFVLGIVAWTVISQAIFRCFYPSFYQYNALYLACWLHAEKCETAFLRHWRFAKGRFDLQQFAHRSWKKIWQFSFGCWCLFGLWLVLALNTYIRFDEDDFVMNGFWDVHEVHFPYESIHRVDFFYEPTPNQYPGATWHLILSFHYASPRDLLGSHNPHGPSPEVVKQLIQHLYAKGIGVRISDEDTQRLQSSLSGG